MKRTVLLLLFFALFFSPAIAMTTKKPLVKKPIAPVKTVNKAPSPEAMVIKEKRISFGYGGGAGRIEFGRNFFNLGFGVGKNYALLALRLEGNINLQNILIVRPSIDAVYYSEKVRNLPGISGTLSKGSALGLGIGIGKNIGKWEWSCGYSSILGATVMAGFRY